MKKLLGVLITILLFVPVFIQADEVQPTNIYFFYGQGCPHCAAEELFLDKLQSEYGARINIQRYEVWHNTDNQTLLQQMAAENDIPISGVPVTFVGKQVIIGFDNEAGLGADIKNAIDKTGSTIIDIPFLGQRDLKNYSLPVLSIIIGTLDGFNPCAMWVLVFLITLLLGMKERWKMWLLGGTFIFASSAVYFLFMAAWLNFLMFLGYVQWLKVGIGIFGLISGILFIREYLKNRAGTCKVVNTDSRKKIFARLKEVVKNPNLLLALGGIILLAFTVNLVELACSLGFPAVFTQILSLANLSSWQYYGYILLYLFFFMLDDMLVFGIAMFTLKVAGFSSKYTRYSNLIGGILIFLIGLMLIFKPDWLMFS